MGTTNEKIALIDSIEEKRTQQKRLLKELKRSLLIQEIWPEAFDYENGQLYSEMKGNASSVAQIKRMIVRFWNEKAEKEFLLVELPFLLRKDYAESLFKVHSEQWLIRNQVLKFIQSLCKEDVK